jgi:hypothetical protein
VTRLSFISYAAIFFQKFIEYQVVATVDADIYYIYVDTNYKSSHTIRLEGTGTGH